MSRTIDSLPDYLRKVCTTQDYSQYTSRQQESWRYIMKQAVPFFKEHAVSVYEEGLKKSSIFTDAAFLTSTKWMRQ